MSIHDVYGDEQLAWVPSYPATLLGVGGSRRRSSDSDAEQVLRYVVTAADAAAKNDRKLVIVSGGCNRGADSVAELVAIAADLDMIRFLPRAIPRDSPRFVAVKALFDRNTRVIEACERFAAQVSPDRTGGTEDAVKKAHKLGRPVDLLKLDGSIELEQPPRRRRSAVTTS